MSKLEYDLENFGRLCHLHDKVAKLEQALAEKDRGIQQIREHEFQRGYRDGEAAAKDAMDRKEQEIACLNTRVDALQRYLCAKVEKTDQYHQLIAEKEREIAKWKAAHDEMVARNRLLGDRPDLPADRIRAHDEWVEKYKRVV